jgi:myxalamid-type polyketide synthase MxaB
VVEFTPGDEVVALASGAFSSHVIADARITARKPGCLSFAQAAAFPVAFLTAQLAFEGVDLAPGRQVLIHAVSGGTGMAAWQIARGAGAEVFGTASPGKWEALQALGIEQLLNSRTTTFAVEMRARNFGDGVDVVLNSLAGDYIGEGLGALHPGGVFLEIGKTGIWTPKQAAAVRGDVSYRLVDLFADSFAHPEATGRRLRELAAAFEDGSLAPLPVNEFPIERAIDAFRTLQQARHVGKIVLTVNAPRSLVRSDATYLIAGGSSGLGLLTAEWLAENGARDVVLVSRQIADGEIAPSAAELNRLGCRVSAVRADIADSEAVNDLFAALASEGRVVRGVVHAAGVLADGLLMDMEWPRFERVLAPKVSGLWNLHVATRALPLDFFVAYSSISSVFGSAGQTNHAAANGFVDGLMEWRDAQGLPALSINWGPWKEFGGAARLGAAIRDRHQQSGVQFIAAKQGQALLSLLWRSRTPRVVVVPVNWERFRSQVDKRAFFDEFQSSTRAASAAAGLSFAGSTGAVLHTKLEALVVSELRVMLGQSDQWLPDEEQGFFGMGLDSLTSLELRNRLEKALCIKLNPTVLFDFPSPQRLVQHLAAQLEPAPVSVPNPVPDAPEGDLADLDTAELAELLAQKLSSMDVLR